MYSTVAILFSLIVSLAFANLLHDTVEGYPSGIMIVFVTVTILTFCEQSVKSITRVKVTEQSSTKSTKKRVKKTNKPSIVPTVGCQGCESLQPYTCDIDVLVGDILVGSGISESFKLIPMFALSIASHDPGCTVGQEATKYCAEHPGSDDGLHVKTIIEVCQQYKKM